MKEKKTESEQNEDESQQNKKWIESLGIKNLPVEERRRHEERRRMTKNLHEIAHGNVSEALRKHLSLDFLHENTSFHPKQLKCIA